MTHDQRMPHSPKEPNMPDIPDLDEHGRARWQEMITGLMKKAGKTPQDLYREELHGSASLKSFEGYVSRFKKGVNDQLKYFFADPERLKALAKDLEISPDHLWRLLEAARSGEDPLDTSWHPAFPGVSADEVEIVAPLVVRTGLSKISNRKLTTCELGEELKQRHDLRGPIHIVGRQGSGRRTIARQLHATLNDISPEINVLIEAPSSSRTVKETQSLVIEPLPWDKEEIESLIERLADHPIALDRDGKARCRRFSRELATKPATIALLSRPDTVIFFLEDVAKNDVPEQKEVRRRLSSSFWRRAVRRDRTGLLELHSEELMERLWTLRWLDPEPRIWWRMSRDEALELLEIVLTDSPSGDDVHALVDALASASGGKRQTAAARLRKALEDRGPVRLLSVLVETGLLIEDDDVFTAAEREVAIVWAARGVARRRLRGIEEVPHRLADDEWLVFAAELAAAGVKLRTFMKALEQLPAWSAVDVSRGVMAFLAESDDTTLRGVRSKVTSHWAAAVWSEVQAIFEPHFGTGVASPMRELRSLLPEVSCKFAAELPLLDGPNYAESLRRYLPPEVSALEAAWRDEETERDDVLLRLSILDSHYLGTEEGRRTPTEHLRDCRVLMRAPCQCLPFSLDDDPLSGKPEGFEHEDWLEYLSKRKRVWDELERRAKNGDRRAIACLSGDDYDPGLIIPHRPRPWHRQVWDFVPYQMRLRWVSHVSEADEQFWARWRCLMEQFDPEQHLEIAGEALEQLPEGTLVRRFLETLSLEPPVLPEELEDDGLMSDHLRDELWSARLLELPNPRELIELATRPKLRGELRKILHRLLELPDEWCMRVRVRRWSTGTWEIGYRDLQHRRGDLHESRHEIFDAFRPVKTRRANKLWEGLVELERIARAAASALEDTTPLLDMWRGQIQRVIAPEFQGAVEWIEALSALGWQSVAVLEESDIPMEECRARLQWLFHQPLDPDGGPPRWEYICREAGFLVKHIADGKEISSSPLHLRGLLDVEKSNERGITFPRAWYDVVGGKEMSERTRVAALTLTSLFLAPGIGPWDEMPDESIQRWIRSFSENAIESEGHHLTTFEPLERIAEDRRVQAGRALLERGVADPLTDLLTWAPNSSNRPEADAPAQQPTEQSAIKPSKEPKRRSFRSAMRETIDDPILATALKDPEMLERAWELAQPGIGREKILQAALDSEGRLRPWIFKAFDWSHLLFHSGEKGVGKLLRDQLAVPHLRAKWRGAVEADHHREALFFALLLHRLEPYCMEIEKSLRAWAIDDPDPLDADEFGWSRHKELHLSGEGEGGGWSPERDPLYGGAAIAMNLLATWIEEDRRPWMTEGVHRIWRVFIEVILSGNRHRGWRSGLKIRAMFEHVGRRLRDDREGALVELLRLIDARDLRDEALERSSIQLYTRSFTPPFSLLLRWWIEDSDDGALLEEVRAESWRSPDSAFELVGRQNRDVIDLLEERVLERPFWVEDETWATQGRFWAEDALMRSAPERFFASVLRLIELDPSREQECLRLLAEWRSELAERGLSVGTRLRQLTAERRKRTNPSDEGDDTQ